MSQDEYVYNLKGILISLKYDWMNSKIIVTLSDLDKILSTTIIDRVTNFREFNLYNNMFNTQMVNILPRL